MTNIQSHPQFSLAKDKIRVLLLEGVNDSAAQMIETAGYSNLTRLPKALDGDALKEAIKGVHLLGIRSRTCPSGRRARRRIARRSGAAEIQSRR